MIDLGSLGGVYAEARGLNNRGQVVGFSTLTGDVFGHAFLWTGGKMQDLGVLGGDFSFFSEANAINDGGEIAGHSFAADGAVRGFRWKSGVMTDLGSVPGYDCSNTGSINARGQIVGWAYRCDDPEGLEHPVLWDEDGPGIDLNVFVPPGSDLELIEADWINDRGEIVGTVTLSESRISFLPLDPRGGERHRERCQRHDDRFECGIRRSELKERDAHQAHAGEACGAARPLRGSPSRPRARTTEEDQLKDSRIDPRAEPRSAGSARVFASSYRARSTTKSSERRRLKLNA